MIGRVWNAYRVEIDKALRRKLTYAGPLLVAIAVGLMPLVSEIARDGVGDYEFVAYATPIVLNLLGLFFLLTYCAGLVSTELGSGTICLVAVRPLRRQEFILAKLALALTYATVLGVLTALLSWGMALAFGDLTGVSFGGEMVYTNMDMLTAYLLGIALSLPPLFAAAAFAVMISSLTRSSGAAVACTIGVWLLMDTVKHPLRIAPYLFSTYIEAPWQVFAGRCNGLDYTWFPSAGYLLGTSLAALCLFSAVAMAALSARNLRVW